MSVQINIILPYKEQFSKNKASSVSITVKNNFDYSSYKTRILVYGQFVDSPILPYNFIGIKKPRNFLKSKNIFMAQEICKIIKKKKDTEHLIEVHNRPYLVKIFDATFEKSTFIFARSGICRVFHHETFVKTFRKVRHFHSIRH